MTIPLTKWRCDVCDEIIEDPSNGYVIWKTDSSMKAYDFKIIHQNDCDRKDHTSSAALPNLLGEKGQAYLLSFLSIGPIMKRNQKISNTRAKDMDEFVDLFRRVQTPYYEEARLKFGDHEVLEDFNDSNEVYPYLPDTLKSIAKES